jgi:trehalose 2-sulfotransferase
MSMAPRPLPVIKDYRDGKAVNVFSVVDTQQAFDRRHLAAPPPRKSYLICFEERSGSTMLCSLLSETTVLGRPDEFLNPRGVIQMYTRQGHAHDLTEYLAYLKSTTTTSNGVFGMKANYKDFLPFLEAGLTKALFGDLTFVYLSRQNLVDQAISGALARKRKLWHARSEDQLPTTDNVEFDEQLVMQLIDEILEHRIQWERFFGLYGVQPLRLTYEALITDPHATVMAIASELGVDLPSAHVANVASTHRLSNRVNLEWAQRIHEKHRL